MNAQSEMKASINGPRRSNRSQAVQRRRKIHGWANGYACETGGALNEDLAREYQAIIAYVVYSQVLTGAEYMSIAAQLEEHAHQELQHALTLSRQIDYLGKMPTVTPKPVKVSEDARDML